MELHFTFPSHTPKYEAIYKQLKQYIFTGQLSANEKLPAKRRLAEQLHVSVHTVQIAYEQLISEGYMYSRERAGYFVSPVSLDWTAMPLSTEAPEITEDATVRYNLKNGQVDESAFPIKQWMKLYKEALFERPIHTSTWQGIMPLREQIAHYLQLARGISCQPAQIVIGSGTQHQLEQLCRFFGDVHVAIEEPGFFRAKSVFQQHRFAIEHVPVDEAGATVPTTDAALYYVTPAHQFPLGYVMPIERKLALLDWTHANSSYIIEDDYDAEFRYKGLPIPPLAQLDNGQHVIYFGTFSKTVMPSLRIGYTVLPYALVEPFQQFYAAQKATVSHVDQLVLTQFIAKGHFSRHIDKMRTLYRKKRARLLEALTHYLPTSFRVLGQSAGLHVIVELPTSLQESVAIQLAHEASIAIDAVSTSYAMSHPTQFVMIGFGAIAYEDIDEAICTLARAWGQATT